ncbi:hypothetical protein HanPSC8_Chr14g0596661 [Helianthus annuus]|nr:hypothetical protein HanPSC8_Chr14g0596661 [Helianthus annuus]
MEGGADIAGFYNTPLGKMAANSSKKKATKGIIGLSSLDLRLTKAKKQQAKKRNKQDNYVCTRGSAKGLAMV